MRWVSAIGAIGALGLAACPINNNITIDNQNTLVQAVPPVVESQLQSLVPGSQLQPVDFLKLGWQRAQAVALVVRADGVRGTGALVSNDLLLTANHVLPDAASARSASVYFGYYAEPLPGAFETLAPDQLFESSPVGEHDWTLVRFAGDPCHARASVPFGRHDAPAGTAVGIIQHPDGLAMKFASGILAAAAGGRLQYSTSTQKGSSGAPVFDGQWNLIGIHREGDISGNGGIGIGTILDDLAQRRGLEPETCSR
jgi:endonuclease G